MKRTSARILSMLLALAIALSLCLPAAAFGDKPGSLPFEEAAGGPAAVSQLETVTEEETAPEHGGNDIVRVSIFLEKASLLDAGFSVLGIAGNRRAAAYRAQVKAEQAAAQRRIETATGADLDVVWNLTLAADVISANVRYGEIETIRGVKGVADVVLETQYLPCVVDTSEPADPNMATSGSMIGTPEAYAAGYTGAGRRLAVIDTGIDMDHQSFDAAAFDYALAQLGETYDLLDEQDIAAVLPQLNIAGRSEGLTAADLYKTTKIPFGYNYIDNTASYIDHNSDSQGEHGSHVEGIAAANRYIPNGDGTFFPALDTVLVQGAAPDAQIVVMKVFGKRGGAYDSDYMAAIEDAIVLGCDSVNLSLGSAAPGYGTSTKYQQIMDRLTESDTLVVISAGNNGHWAQYSQNGRTDMVYDTDVNTDTVGQPGSYRNSLTVASADNAGATGDYIEVAGQKYVYTENSSNSKNVPLRTLAGEQEYIFLDGYGTEEDFAAVGDALTGKLALCSRGGGEGLPFAAKATNAMAHGAIGLIVYNNVPGIISMNLSGYKGTQPCVSIRQSEGMAIRAASTPVKDGEGNILYYTGTMTVGDHYASVPLGESHYSMSSFSSWGVPGTLELKPEITAPGGSIYSVNGAVEGGKAYEIMSGTSMAAPQVTGMGAIIGQYIAENKLDEKTGLSSRVLGQSLLMSTAVPMTDENGNEYPILRQGAGLANIGKAVSSGSYLLMDENATASWADGKIKAELGDDPARTGVYTFSFTLHNLTDSEQTYFLSADLFSQRHVVDDNGRGYLGTDTQKLSAVVSWNVDGRDVASAVDMLRFDINGDGRVDEADAQAILDMVTGKCESAAKADVDGDGSVTSYDAYVLLHELGTSVVALPANGSVHISVTATLTGDQKAALDEAYPNGTYVQGFFYAEQQPDAEGVEGVRHSIPMLAFYGSWADPSMYEPATYTGRLYGDTTKTYTGVRNPNVLWVKYPGESDPVPFSGNPYLVEDSYPAGREAINSQTTISRISVSLIRNASAAEVIALAEDGSILLQTGHTQYTGPAFNYRGTWQMTYATATMNRSPEALRLSEGDRFTAGVLSVPEYYGTDGPLTQEQTAALVKNGLPGKGLLFSQTFTVDNTAPVMTGVYKDLETGDLKLTVHDDRYIAAVQVLNRSGIVLATAAVPQDAPGQTVDVTIDLQGKIVGQECTVVVCDYAKNETAYTVAYGGAEEDYTGRMFGFTPSSYRSDENTWLELDPANVWYDSDTKEFGGTTPAAAMGLSITAAAYVDGYVYMAASDGCFYIAEQGAWPDSRKAGTFSGTTKAVNAMTYDAASKTMYVLGASNDLYTMDLSSCALTKLADITIVNPATKAKSYLLLSALAVDGDGTFYAVNNGTYSRSLKSAFVYRFTLADIQDGRIADLAAMNPVKEGHIPYYTKFASLAWDSVAGKLYLSTGNSAAGSAYAYLAEIDRENGSAGPVNTAHSEAAASLLYAPVLGMYVVPQQKQTDIPKADLAASITLSDTELTCLVGTKLTLTAELLPWNLTDQTVTWTTSDPALAAVTDGVVTALAEGDVTITATTNAEPHLAAQCILHIRTIRSDLSGLAVTEDGTGRWAEFNTAEPEKWRAVGDAAGAYFGGVMLDETIYVNDGSHAYAIDPDKFTIKADYGELAAQWCWTDAAPAPERDGAYNAVIGICNSGTMLNFIRFYDEKLNYWDTAAAFGSEPLAGIAYIGEGTCHGGMYGICPSQQYYVITESGTVWQLDVYTPNDGIEYMLSYKRIGATSLDLTGTNTLDSGRRVSMEYDAELNQLLLAHGTEDGAKLYAVDLGTMLVAELGSFPGLSAMAGLYRYDRAETLTVKMRTKDCRIFVNDTLRIDATVVPDRYSAALTWSSDNTAVATVDEAGVVTAHAPGSAVITATSVDENEAGEHASASVTITVEPLRTLDADVTAQVTDHYGNSRWVSIHTADMTKTELGLAKTQLLGGGVFEGKIYGSPVSEEPTDNMVCIDPENSYQETLSTGTVQQSFYIRDLVGIPKSVEMIPDKDGNTYEREVFGHAYYLAKNKAVMYIEDFDSAEVSGWTLMPAFFHYGIGAMAHAGRADYETEKYGTVNAHLLYILGNDGTLYQFYTYNTYNKAILPGTPSGVQQNLNYVAIGKVGQTFRNVDDMTMTYIHDENNEGLIVGYGDACAELYYIDLTAEELRCEKLGNFTDEKFITSLFTPQELTLAPTRIARAGTDTVSSTSVSLDFFPQDEVATQTANDEGTLHEAQPSAPAPEDGTVIRLQADGAANGYFDVHYDAALLQLESVESPAALVSVNAEDGRIRIAYAGRKAPDIAAVVRFTAKANAAADVTVRTLEAGSEKPDTEQTLHLLCPSAAYPDLDTAQWYHPYTDHVIGRGLMIGDGTRFEPDAAMTRAMLIQTLYNLSGRPEVAGSSGFVDVDENAWYARAVAWARQSGVTLGVDDTHFAPDRAASREEVVCFLYRYVKDYCHAPVDVRADLGRFTDGRQVSAYAVDAMQWAVGAKLVQGLGDGRLDPRGTTIRSHLAALLTVLDRDILAD